MSFPLISVFKQEKIFVLDCDSIFSDDLRAVTEITRYASSSKEEERAV